LGNFNHLEKMVTFGHNRLQSLKMFAPLVALKLFPGCAQRQSLCSLARPVSVLAISIFTGLLSNQAFAATHTTSILVSTTVVAGCQVSPAAFLANGAASAITGWSAPVAVTCSLAVPYQVAVSGVSRVPFAGLGSTGREVAVLAANEQAGQLASPRPPIQPTQATTDPGHGLDALVSIADPPTGAPDPGAVTVTIVY
jgi:hypothetical protein